MLPKQSRHDLVASWTKLLISLQRRSCVVLWLSRLSQLSMMLPSCLRQRLTPNRPSVADARAVEKACGTSGEEACLAQWTTRKPPRKRRTPETDVGDGEEGFREFVSGQEERVNFTIFLKAVLVVVLESCERCFDSACFNMFGLAQRVHIPSFRTAQHAALTHLAATAPSKLNSREGCLHWWRLLLENFELNSDSMAKDMQVLMRKDLEAVELFRQLLGVGVSLQNPQSSLFPRIFPSCPTNSCVATWNCFS